MAQPRVKSKTTILQRVQKPLQDALDWWNKQLEPVHPVSRFFIKKGLFVYSAAGVAYVLAYAVQNMDQDTLMMIIAI